MNKKTVIIVAAVVGAYLLLRKPPRRRAAQPAVQPASWPGTTPQKPAGGVTELVPQAPSVVPSGTGKIVVPSGVTEVVEKKDEYVNKINNYFVKPTLPANEPPLDPGATPDNPSDTPLEGRYYRIRKGDTMIGLVRKLGLTDRKWRKLRDHPKNSWIPTGKFRQGQTEKEWKLFRRYDPPGYKSRLRTKGTSSTVYPVAYMITKEESL